MPYACSVNVSKAPMDPKASISLRVLSNPLSKLTLSSKRPIDSSSLRFNFTEWPLLNLESSAFIPSSSSLLNIEERSGLKGLADGPKKPGRTLLRTRPRPCIKSTNAGEESRGVPKILFTTHPMAGQPPAGEISEALNPD